MESILTSIKKLLGPGEAYDCFDTDIIIHINTVLSVLNQLGVGPKEGFVIQDASAVWTDFITDNAKLELVKSYTYLKVKLLFDPPLGTAVIQSMNRMIDELEWRIQTIADPVQSSEEEIQNGE